MRSGCHDITGHSEKPWPDDVRSSLSSVSFSCAFCRNQKVKQIIFFLMVCFLASICAPLKNLMLEIWDDWRRGSSWGEIQPKDNDCARPRHPSAAGASGTDAAPVVCLRAPVLSGLSRAARLPQRLQLHGRPLQSAQCTGGGQEGQLQQGGAHRGPGSKSSAQQNSLSVSPEHYTLWIIYNWHKTITSKLNRRFWVMVGLGTNQIGPTWLNQIGLLWY